jgi:hypothetical protein
VRSCKKKMARPERFELPTNWFEASYSIQLSYGRVSANFTLFQGREHLLRTDFRVATGV